MWVFPSCVVSGPLQEYDGNIQELEDLHREKMVCVKEGGRVGGWEGGKERRKEGGMKEGGREGGREGGSEWVGGWDKGKEERKVGGWGRWKSSHDYCV